MKTCEKTHRHSSEEEFKSIPEHQGKKGRHKCAGCAYDLGYEDGKVKSPPCLDIAALPGSQANFHRHKSVECAYALGYINGFKLAK